MMAYAFFAGIGWFLLILGSLVFFRSKEWSGCRDGVAFIGLGILIVLCCRLGRDIYDLKTQVTTQPAPTTTVSTP